MSCCIAVDAVDERRLLAVDVECAATWEGFAAGDVRATLPSRRGCEGNGLAEAAALGPFAVSITQWPVRSRRRARYFGFFLSIFVFLCFVAVAASAYLD